MTPTITVHTGSLAELRVLLERETKATSGRWARRRLPSDIVVSMRWKLTRRGKLQLAIGRDVAPITPEGKAAFQADVERIAKLMGAGAWVRGEDIHTGATVTACFIGSE